MTEEFEVDEPTFGDMIIIETEYDEEVIGNVLAWGIKKWGKFWAVVDAYGTTYVNMDKISHFYIVSDDEEEDDDNKGRLHIVDFQKKKQEIENSPTEPAPETTVDKVSPFKHVESGPFKVEAKLDPKIGVVEPEVNMEGITPETLPESLEDLYLEKKKALHENIKDHLSNEDTKDINTNYEMPSFKKRT